MTAAKAFRAEVFAQKSAQTTKLKDLSHIHAVMLHGVDQHGLDETLLRQLKMPKASRQKGKGKKMTYLPFTNPELVLLFQSNAYIKGTFKKP